jgi:hypothetical protein
MNKTINGTDYLVIGSNVFRQGSSGIWVTVDDPNEKAAAGEMREHDGIEYSQVGDKVFAKGSLGGWSLVTDHNAMGIAGEHREVDGREYSVVGNNVFKRGTLGGWELVESDGERASVGEIREIDGCDFSVVGDCVYKRGTAGGWVEVDNDNERALAGEMIEADQVTYSRVGNTIFRYGPLGAWVSLDAEEMRRVVGRFAVTEGANVPRESTGQNDLISPKTLMKIFAVIAVACMLALLIPFYASKRKADIKKDVTKNLKQLSIDAQQYFIEEMPFPAKVRGGTLIDRYHSKIDSVDGEDYRDLEIVQDCPLTIRTKHCEEVRYTP